MALVAQQDLEHVTMASLVEQVLPFRSPSYVQDLIEKLLSEGIASPSDLLKASKDAVEQKLSTHASFNFIEMADVLSLRSSMDPDKPKELTRRASPGRRGRSRSPANRSHSGGRRANSRPHRGNNRNGSNNRNNSHHRNNGNNHRGGRPDPPELWRAVEKGDEAAVRRLLDENVDAEEKFQGWTPFMKAAEEGQVEILRMLNEKGVDMEAANRRGRTALSFAAAPSMKINTRRQTPVDALRFLLQLKVDTTKKCERGMTAKDYAKEEKREDALKVFDEFEI